MLHMQLGTNLQRQPRYSNSGAEERGALVTVHQKNMRGSRGPFQAWSLTPAAASAAASATASMSCCRAARQASSVRSTTAGAGI